MNVLVSGSSGMIGSAITAALQKDGHNVYPLLRNKREGPFYYLQKTNYIHLDRSIGLDVVINLAGSNISQNRWTSRVKKNILDSRVKTTQTLCNALSELPQKPHSLLSASAIGYYGTHPSEIFSEFSSAGKDFLSQVAINWERATAPAEERGIRTCHLRFGLVLSPQGGLINNLLLPLRLATVGVIGSGNQMISWISLCDAITVMKAIIDKPSFSGPINLTSNQPASNRELVQTLSSAIQRPALPRMPGKLIQILFGEMADAALLSGAHVISERVKELEIDLEHKTLSVCLDKIM